MISHYMTGKRVSWYTLQKIKLGKTIEYMRKINYGKVVDVSTCGNLCLVVEDNGVQHEIETSEVDSLD